jgi:hypothetical protein
MKKNSGFMKYYTDKSININRLSYNAVRERIRRYPGIDPAVLLAAKPMHDGKPKNRIIQN